MAEQEKPTARQIALRRQPTTSGIAAELLTLLETVTADGTISDAEAAELRTWLAANRESDLPAIDFLLTTLEQILADGIITQEERKALHKAVERVLPRELREKSKGRRESAELLEKVRLREKKWPDRLRAIEERQRNRPVFAANFMVAGVVYEGRSKTIEQYLQEGQTVFLVREPGNQFDPNAVGVLLKEGFPIGYVPRETAATMALFLDQGYKQAARCSKILHGRRAPIPVIQGRLYRPDTTVDGTMSASELPARLARPVSSGTGCLLCLGTSLLLLAYVIALVM